MFGESKLQSTIGVEVINAASVHMALDEIVQYIASFLGGGATVAVGNWIHANRSARRERAISHLDAEVRLLYGPLSFFTKQNKELFQMCENVHKAHEEYFAGKWSNDQDTQKHLTEMGSAKRALSGAVAQSPMRSD
jgi:hypothetical protein